MRNFKALFQGFIVFCVLIQSSGLEGAAGYRIASTGSPDIGLAQAGSAARARDAATALYNPAGMTLLDSSQLMFALQPLYYSSRWDFSSDTTFNGNKGGKVGSAALGMSGFVVFGLTDKIKVGFSTFTPGAVSQNNGRDWKGRFFVQRELFFSLTGNLSVAYEVCPNLSVAAGFSTGYGFLIGSTALPDANGVTTLPNQDRIQINFDNLDNLAYGYNFGILYEVSPCTRVGLIYHSELDFRLRGRVEIDTSNGISFVHGRTSVPIPQYVVASFYHQYNCRLALLGSAGWDDWSTLKRSVLKISNGTVIDTKRNWYDTWNVAFGAEFRVCPPLLLQAGVSYDSSPMSDKFRLPTLAYSSRLNFTTGVIYQSNNVEQFSCGLLYEMSTPRKRPVDQEFIDRFKAKLSPDLFLLGFSYNRKFGCQKKKCY